MNKLIIGIIIMLIIGVAVWWFYPDLFRRQTATVPREGAGEQSPPPPAFDTNDNLDQALQDLESI